MASTLEHRGPDDSGVWVDGTAGIVLGHRRLSIVDLSEAGHQPMNSWSGRYVMVFNGEIYNHAELRRELGRGEWRGHSDTETLLALIEGVGLEDALCRSIGMFAMAVWDRSDRTLWLARDRMGEKPLFYGWQGKTFMFGSELRALECHPDFLGDVDRAALQRYLNRMYLAAPHTIYQGIRKLDPGTVLRLDAADPLGAIRAPGAYWSLAGAVAAGRADPFAGSEEEAADELERRLATAVRRQMVADVPVGAFLSGGVDSSTVVSLMQEYAPGAVRTFTIGFSEEAFNEARHAAEVAAHLGTDHHELYISPRDALEVVPLLPSVYDEPFADSSAIPTFLVARLARQEVTVSLSGDGGDELFCGYGRYGRTARHWKRLGWSPPRLRRAAAAVLPSGPAARTRTMAAGSSAPSPLSMYHALTSCWQPRDHVVAGMEREPVSTGSREHRDVGGPFEERFMYVDGRTYLPGDILTKVDRAAMANSLETRVPLLDHRVVEFAWSLPMAYKCSGGETKRVLRRLLARRVPPTLTERPKMGFGVPLAEWLRGPLRGWAEDLLAPQRLKREGFLNPTPVGRAWTAHLSGRRDLNELLWSVLMFQAWLERKG